MTAWEYAVAHTERGAVQEYEAVADLAAAERVIADCGVDASTGERCHAVRRPVQADWERVTRPVVVGEVSPSPWPPPNLPARWQRAYAPHRPTFTTAADGAVRWRCACGHVRDRVWARQQAATLSHTWHVKGANGLP